jgi:hypothetical protein
MRIFLAFFGLTRSLRHTIGSIRAHITEPLAAGYMEAPRYGHFHLPAEISNARSGEFGLPADPAEVALLDLDAGRTDPQDLTLIADPLAVAAQYPDHYGDNYASVRNLCFQLRSLHELWGLLEPVVTEQDWVAFLRPDLLYLDPLDLAGIVARMLRDGSHLAVPAWQAWGGLNDRFAIANARAAKIYATRLTRLEAATASMGALHAETLLGYTAAVERLRVARVPARAIRIRANGQPAVNDLMCFGLRGAMRPAA